MNNKTIGTGRSIAITQLQSLFQRIAGLAPEVSPTPFASGQAGVLVETEPFDALVHDIAERCSCWRVPGESLHEHRRRLELHLHTIAVAVEDDLRLLLGERNSPDA